ncbi:MAG: PqqD family protein [Candidatus Competibacteraceae bacterium]
MYLLPHRNPNVIFQKVSDGAVLLSTWDEVYYGLNSVGVQIWELLPPQLHTVDELCHALRLRYPNVDATTIRLDALELLNDLSKNGLVQPVSETDNGNQAQIDSP